MPDQPRAPGLVMTDARQEPEMILVEKEKYKALLHLRDRVVLYFDARSEEQASVVGGCLTAMKEALRGTR